MVFACTVLAFVSVYVTSPSHNPGSLPQQLLLHSPLLFLMFVMLTEPVTTPATRLQRIVYGGFVGLLFAPFVHIGSIYSTPELALLVGNLFSYVLDPKQKISLSLKNIERISRTTSDFVFASKRAPKFLPGQYMEWTFPHKKSDSRGVRRYFTIASSPTERDVHLGVRFTPKGSSFKQALSHMQPNQEITALYIGGEFTLPRDPSKKLAFIAGGIGITPFRSMVKYLLDTHEKRDISMLYSNRTVDDIAYKEVFDEAKRVLGLTVLYAVTDEEVHGPDMHQGLITKELIQEHISDYRERIFYLSGPRGMVTTFQKVLTELGVTRSHVRVDFFPGFA